jgi:hypothetical protein
LISLWYGRHKNLSNKTNRDNIRFVRPCAFVYHPAETIAKNFVSRKMI